MPNGCTSHMQEVTDIDNVRVWAVRNKMEINAEKLKDQFSKIIGSSSGSI